MEKDVFSEGLLQLAKIEKTIENEAIIVIFAILENFMLFHLKLFYQNGIYRNLVFIKKAIKLILWLF